MAVLSNSITLRLFDISTINKIILYPTQFASDINIDKHICIINDMAFAYFEDK